MGATRDKTDATKQRIFFVQDASFQNPAIAYAQEYSYLQMNYDYFERPFFVATTILANQSKVFTAYVPNLNDQNGHIVGWINFPDIKDDYTSGVFTSEMRVLINGNNIHWLPTSGDDPQLVKNIQSVIPQTLTLQDKSTATLIKPVGFMPTGTSSDNLKDHLLCLYTIIKDGAVAGYQLIGISFKLKEGFKVGCRYPTNKTILDEFKPPLYYVVNTTSGSSYNVQLKVVETPKKKPVVESYGWLFIALFVILFLCCFMVVLIVIGRRRRIANMKRMMQSNSHNESRDYMYYQGKDVGDDSDQIEERLNDYYSEKRRAKKDKGKDSSRDKHSRVSDISAETYARYGRPTDLLAGDLDDLDDLAL